MMLSETPAQNWGALVSMALEDAGRFGRKFKPGVKDAALRALINAPPFFSTKERVAIVVDVFEEFEIEDGIKTPWGMVVKP